MEITFETTKKIISSSTVVDGTISILNGERVTASSSSLFRYTTSAAPPKTQTSKKVTIVIVFQAATNITAFTITACAGKEIYF